MKGFISLTLPTIQPGHIDVVEFCKNRCNELLIGLTSDELCLRDNIDTVADFNTRSSILKSIFPNIEIFFIPLFPNMHVYFPLFLLRKRTKKNIIHFYSFEIT